MATEKEKQVFQEALKGQKVARDRFGTPMVAGEIIAYAISSNSSAHLKVGKILKVNRTDTVRRTSLRQPDGSWTYAEVPDQKISLTVRGADNHVGYDGSSTGWKLQKNSSRLENIHNIIVLTEVKQEILDLYKDIHPTE